MNWKELKVNDHVIYSWNEFDGCGSVKGTVTKIHDDHVIVKADGQNLWIDDDNADMFRKEI